MIGVWTWSIRVATRVASKGLMLFEPIIAMRDSRFENPDQSGWRVRRRRARSIGRPERRRPFAPDAGTVYRVQGRRRQQAGVMGQDCRLPEAGGIGVRPRAVPRS